MTTAQSYPQRLRVAHLNPQAPNPFEIQPDAAVCTEIAEELELLGLSKLSFKGEVRARGKDEWVLTGQLKAHVVQPCVVSLKPVKTTIQEDVLRQYSPDFTAPEAEEIEMLDESLEPLAQFIDISAVMLEELVLTLPEYPRAKGVELSEPDETEPESDTRRPFADLGKLMKDSGKTD